MGMLAIEFIPYTIIYTCNTTCCLQSTELNNGQPVTFRQALRIAHKYWALRDKLTLDNG